MSMSSQEMIELCKRHTLYTWAAQAAVDPIPVARAEGVYMYTPEGERILDFNSQLMCVNIGHSHPKVIAAMKEQLDGLIYVYPGTATELRARLGKRLADLTPGDINTFFFTLGGAEANENAIRIARAFTGRQKIMARYRSYHGATQATMALTGDPRRWSNEAGTSGVVRVMDPNPYDYSFGQTDEERVDNNLRYLEEVIMYEGGHTIAAMIVETVTGTNGILAPPGNYLPRLHELLKRHGILLICDEVMAGFGRTGKMYAFEHWGVVPDLVTMAKGLTSAYSPLGAVGISDRVAAHFQQNTFFGGLTYNSHNLCLGAAMANLDVLEEEDLIGNAVRMGAVMRAEMDRLVAKHPSAKVGRQIGLFGMMDIQKNSAGAPLAPYNGGHPKMKEFADFLRAQGLFTFVRWSSFTCNPPLCITAEQLKEGFEIIDRALDITDQAFEG
ncbi:MAG: aminotransferase class III-fold pyridoxal phosphate-dependent enzyme [Deltaproteobacteria bacterium]|nr:aminotransferase class III-fold pyridoxal phosphate-dependent enzyme [Deltaproteobacteria bacterium]